MWAAMGADKTSQPNTTGYSKAFAGTGAIGGNAWYSVNANSKTHQVGKKYANELGIHDMSGNVYEWCWDGYNDSVGTGELTDPVGLLGTDRVIRGGGWYYDASESTVARRRNGPPNGRNLDIGFRVVCSAVTP
jgi:formylglycine-generating enzyme required for sulfatase activity